MIRTTIAALSMILVMMLAAVPAPAQKAARDEITPEIIAALKKEPPLTQADIDVFVKIMPEISKAAQKSPAEIIKIYEKAGLTENRFSLIFSRVTLGMLMAGGVSRKTITDGPEVPEVLMPSEADMALIFKNMDVLEKIFDRNL